ncbi:MAG: Hemolysin C [Nitrospira sp.]|nr:Hemolysin C [Nitrospira sp.]
MDVLILFALIAISAVISAVEIGFFAVNDTKLHALAQTGSARAKLALHLRSDPQKLLSTILVGDRLVGVATPMYATFLTLNTYGGHNAFDEAIAVMVGLLTFVLLVAVDVIPKTLAAKFAVPVTLNMAYPVYGVQLFLKPFLFVMVPLIYKLTGGKGLALPLVTEEELKIMLDEGGKIGTIEVEKVKMIKNVFQLKEITAEDAMTPRLYVFSLDGNLRLKEAQDLLYNSKYSRIPVYDGALDNITGILYKMRALTELAKGQNEAKLKDIAYSPLFVPAGKMADDLMKQFQQEKRHMAVVVNEFGGVMGIVTLEDLLEEVVGEIMDETDITEELIKRLGKNQILVHGRTEVRKINDFLKVDLGDEAVTIGGLIQQEIGRIPKVGEEVRIANCRILIHEAEPRSIRSVQIYRDEKSPVHVESPNLDLVS